MNSIRKEETLLLERKKASEPSETKDAQSEHSQELAESTADVQPTIEKQPMPVTEERGREEVKKGTMHKLRHKKKKSGRRGKKVKGGSNTKKPKDQKAPQDDERFTSRSPDRKENLASKRKRWRKENAKRRNRNKLMSHSSDDLQYSSGVFMGRVYDMHEWLLDSMRKVNKQYEEMSRMTRQDIMMGTRHVLEELAIANGYIYDGITSMTDWIRQVYMEAHKVGVVRKIGHRADDSMREKVRHIREKNFRPLVERRHGLEMDLRKAQRDTELMKTKCLSEGYQLANVRKLFLDNYDRTTVSDIYDNLKLTIVLLNGGIPKSSRMRKLEREKTYISMVRDDLRFAKGILTNASSGVRDIYMKFRENSNLLRKWRSEKRRNANVNIQRDESEAISEEDHQKLVFLVKKANLHRDDLKNINTAIQRSLGPVVQRARIAMKRQTNTTGWPQFPADMNRFELSMKTSFAALDGLRVMVGGKSELTYNLDCKPWTGDFLCDEEGSGEGSGSVEATFMTDDEDFTFDGEEIAPSNQEKSAGHLRSLRRELGDFTTNTLRESETLSERATKLRTRAEELQASWSQSNRSDLSSFVFTGREVVKVHREVRGDVQNTRNKLKQIIRKLDDFDNYDLDSIVAKAKNAAERASKVSLIEKRPTTTTTTTTTTKTTTATTPAVAVRKRKTTSAPDPEVTTNTTPGSHGFSEFSKNVRELRSNVQDLESLNAQVGQSCGKINKKFNSIQGSISMLRGKINAARKMLSSLQVSVKTAGQSYIPVNISTETSPSSVPSITTTFSLGVKPTTMDGTLLVIKGNDSASYSVTLDDGEVTITAYDASEDDLDYFTLNTELEVDKWYFMSVHRKGLWITVSLMSQEGLLETRRESISSLPLFQPLPSMAFVGGVPENSKLSDEGSWQGCVGTVTVNGHSLALVAPHADGSNTSLCAERVRTNVSFSTVFDGDGFVHFERSPNEMITEISLKFRTFHRNGALLSLRNKNRDFALLVSLANGAVKVETSIQQRQTLILSKKKQFNDGKNHVLQIRLQRGSTPYPTIDGERDAFSRERQRPRIPPSLQNGLLIGAFVSDDRKFLDNGASPLIGCIGEVSINQERLFVEDAIEVYNSYQGTCQSNVAHSCWRFTSDSKPVPLGSVDDSNVVFLRVSRDSRGPLVYYERLDEAHPFKFQLVMTSEGLNASIGESHTSIKRPEEDTSEFSLIKLLDDGNDVQVEAWGQEIEVRYFDSWWTEADLDHPHNITVAGLSKGEDGEGFTGAITYFESGDPQVDFNEYINSHSLSLCSKPTGDTIGPSSSAQVPDQIEPLLTCV